MNVHVEAAPADGKAPEEAKEKGFKAYMSMEGSVCDLARLTLAISIIGEDLREALRDGDKVYRKSTDLLDVCRSQLELLFTYIDDAKDDASALRVQYYGRAA